MCCLALLLLAAAPVGDGEALTQAGHDAFARGDLAGAASLYERAELRATDPGLVAFNLASVRYRLALETGDPRLLAEAEKGFRSCLSAGDPRRPQALLGLGNCLAEQAAGRDADGLRAALDAYGECLRDPATPAEVAADARHNRERARLLLAQFSPERATEPPPPGGDNPRDPAPKATEPAPAEHPEPRPRQRPTGEPVPTTDKTGQVPRETSEQAPGKGNLPPVPDRDNLPPLSARDAAAHLEQAAARIRDERRRALRTRAARPPAAGVRDW
jgi:hypothetical protein